MGTGGRACQLEDFCSDITWQELWVPQLLLPLVTAICLCPGMAILCFLYNAIHSRRVHRWFRKYLGTTEKPPLRAGMLHTCNVLQMLFSAVNVLLMVERSYSHMVTWGSRILELALCTFFVFHYFIKACINEFDFLYPLSKPGLVDVFSIATPLYFLTTPPAEIPWVSLGYIRIYVCVWTYKDVASASYYIQQLSEVSRTLILLVLDTAALVITLACTVMLLEILGDPEFLQHDDIPSLMGDISFEKMVYWIFTTISTVGYGDFTPQHMLSRIVVVYAIVTGVVLFSVQTGKLMTLQTLEDAGKGRYHSDNRHDYLVVVGGAVSQFSWVLPNFLTELYELENAETIPFPRAVLMAPRETHPELREFIRSMPKHARERIHYFYGNVMSSDDMQRVNLEGAKLAVVLPDVRAPDPNQEDQDNILRALAMKRASPKINLRLMMIKPESKARAVDIGIQDGRCFSIYELKSNLVVESCRCRGFSTLISNLISSDVGDDAEQEMEEIAGSSPLWFQHYTYGFSMDFHGLAIDDRFIGQTFSDFASEAFKCGVAPVAAQIDGRIVLNPPSRYRFSKDDIVFVVHPGGSHLMGKQLENTHIDWRTTFVTRQARARRIPRRASGGPMNLENPEESPSQQEKRHTRANVHRSAVAKEDGRTLPQFALWARKAAARPILGTSNVMQSTQANKPAAFHIEDDELEELEELTEILADAGGHVLLVLLDKNMWHHVQAFVRSLRAEYLPVFQPIIVLTENPPPRELLKETAWTFHEVSFWIGRPTSNKDLYKAGMQSARMIVLLTGAGPLTCDWHMVDALAVMTLVNIENEATDAHTVVELLNEDSVRLLSRYPSSAKACDSDLDEAEATEALPSAIRRSNTMQKSSMASARKSVAGAQGKLTKSGSKLFGSESGKRGRHSRVVPVNAWADKASLRQVESIPFFDQDMFNCCPRFASGNIFTASCLGVLMARAYYTPGIIELVEAILLGDKKRQESFPYQIRIPRSFAGQPYLQLIDKLLSGWPMRSSSSDDCQAPGAEKDSDECTGAIPLGIYRVRIPRSDYCQEEENVSHVITNPPRTFILEPMDLVFVIGSVAFGAACLNEGILVEAAPQSCASSRSTSRFSSTRTPRCSVLSTDLPLHHSQDDTDVCGNGADMGHKALKPHFDPVTPHGA